MYLGQKLNLAHSLSLLRFGGLLKEIIKNPDLDYTIRIGSTQTFLYFDLYLYSAYTQHTTFISLFIFRFVSLLCLRSICIR